jgi:hypothetical protein
VSKRKRKSLGQAMGSAIVGFDYQVFRATKPPSELVEQGKPIAPVPAADGGRISIELPGVPPHEPTPGDSPDAASGDVVGVGPDDSDSAALDDSSPTNPPDR